MSQSAESEVGSARTQMDATNERDRERSGSMNFLRGLAVYIGLPHCRIVLRTSSCAIARAQTHVLRARALSHRTSA